MLIGKQ